VRTSLRERFGINYDKTLQEITPDHAGQGRWAAQRAEDKKFEQTKKDILEYLDTEKGLPAEAGEWHTHTHTHTHTHSHSHTHTHTHTHTHR
jgi:hypothetical protein